MLTAKFYQVGGSVRDKFLGLSSKDIDYAVEAPSFANMREAILERGGTIYLEKEEYLTIRGKVPTLGDCDFVLCRKDGVYSDGRRPESVEVGTILDDLARRDFTVNAIAIAEDGTVIDPHKGQEHLKQRKLICVGKAEDRFTEDGLRMLRAIRFSITKNLVLDSGIECLIDNPYFLGPRMIGVSLERIREELHKCFIYSTPITLSNLGKYKHLRDFIFASGKIWLKPTLEER